MQSDFFSSVAVDKASAIPVFDITLAPFVAFIAFMAFEPAAIVVYPVKAECGDVVRHTGSSLRAMRAGATRGIELTPLGP